MLDIKENVPLAPYTIYKIGGPARFFVEVKNADELQDALIFINEKKMPLVILGAGSNVLISDNGFNGLVIRMIGGNISVDGEHMHVDAGVMMARVVTESGKYGLHRFEWGIGIPGTIGGSVRGNAGCFGGEMKDVVERVRVFQFPISKSQIQNFQTEIFELSNDECRFGYRDSVFKTHPEWVILSAILKLQKGDTAEVQQEIRRIMQERVAKQDIGAKCCGCIFKNVLWSENNGEKEKLLAQFPELAQFRERQTIPSAFLIDRAGLKGCMIGAIYISEKHANFFVNKGGGTSRDVCALIAKAKEKVKKKFSIDLHEEIQMIVF